MISGISSGTSAFIRWLLALLITGMPDLASSSSVSSATLDGKTGKREVAIQSGTAGLHCHSRDRFRYRSFEHPSCGLSIVFAGGIVGCRNCGDFKPGMIGEQLDQSLSDGSGRRKDAGTQFSFHGSITLPSVSISMSSGVASTP